MTSGLGMKSNDTQCNNAAVAGKVQQRDLISDSPHRPMRVMIVDDNHINLSVLSTLLKRRFNAFLDGQPVCVDSGLKAIQLLRTHVFDLILMDIQMPFLSGLDATLRIRKGEDGVLAANRDAHIVAVTTAVGDEPEAAYRRAGMDGMIGKPVRLQDIQHYLCPLSREASHAAQAVLPILVDDCEVMPPLPPVVRDRPRIFYLPADATLRSPMPEICKGADFEKQLQAQTRASLRQGGAIAIARSDSWSDRSNSTKRHAIQNLAGKLFTRDQSDRISEEEDSQASSTGSRTPAEIVSKDRHSLPPNGPPSPYGTRHARSNSSMMINKHTLNQQIARELANLDVSNSDPSDALARCTKPTISSDDIPRRPTVLHRMSSPAWIEPQGPDEKSEVLRLRSPLPNNFRGVSSHLSERVKEVRPKWLLAMNRSPAETLSTDDESCMQSPLSSSFESSASTNACQTPEFVSSSLICLRRDSQRSNDTCTSDVSSNLTTPASELPDVLANSWPTMKPNNEMQNHVRSISVSSTDTAEGCGQLLQAMTLPGENANVA